MMQAFAQLRDGIVAKVHHAIIDGVSGAEILASFFDLSPDPTPRPLFGAPSDTSPAARAGEVSSAA